MADALILQLDLPLVGVGRIRAAGELDVATAHALLDAVDVGLDVLLDGDGDSTIELDLRSIGFCDVAGARAVVAATGRASRRTRHVELRQSSSVRRALRLSELDRALG